jgi:hypothetical protein
MRLRFSLRALLIVVAAFGIALGVWRLRQQHAQSKRLADYHDSRIGVDGINSLGVICWQNSSGEFIFDEQIFIIYSKDQGKEEVQRRMDQYRRRIKANQDWHERMKQKYLLAATRPWLPIEPDAFEPPIPSRP